MLLNNVLMGVATKGLKCFILIFSLLVVFKISSILFKKFLLRNVPSESRALTIYAIIHDLVKYIIWVIIILGVLIIIGVDLGLLIASFGVISIVVGLAAQQVIMDLINGFFTLVEGYYDVGDYVKIGEYEGYVISFGIKVTVLQTYSNQLITIPNSKIVEIINYSKEDYAQILSVGISYDADVLEIEQMLVTDLDKVMKQDPKVIGFEYIGVDGLNDSNVSLAFKLVCNEADRFYVKRLLNKEVKVLFDANGVEIPFNQLVVHSK